MLPAVVFESPVEIPQIRMGGGYLYPKYHSVSDILVEIPLNGWYNRLNKGGQKNDTCKDRDKGHDRWQAEAYFDL